MGLFNLLFFGKNQDEKNKIEIKAVDDDGYLTAFGARQATLKSDALKNTKDFFKKRIEKTNEEGGTSFYLFQPLEVKPIEEMTEEQIIIWNFFHVGGLSELIIKWLEKKGFEARWIDNPYSSRSLKVSW